MSDLASEARVVLDKACRHVGLDPSDADLLRLRSNAVFKLRAPVIVRITTSAGGPERLPAVLAMTRWLHARGFPTVRPLDDVEQPVHISDATITFWRHVPACATPPRTADLGELLRRLHELPAPPVDLPAFDDPLRGIRHDVHYRPGVLTPRERSWLMDLIAELDQEWKALPFGSPPTTLHGDAWIDNLLRHREGHPVLCDWDSVSTGPREWDLIHTHHGRRRFGLTRPDVESFTDAYGYDLRSWPGYDSLMRIRDVFAVGIHIRNAPGDPFSRRELARRLHTLRTGSLTGTWRLRP
jgi:hypothetical protein